MFRNKRNFSILASSPEAGPISDQQTNVTNGQSELFTNKRMRMSSTMIESRNNSLLSSPSIQQNNAQSPSCTKQTRLSSTLRNSPILAELVERSPLARGTIENNLTLMDRFKAATSMLTLRTESSELNQIVESVQTAENGKADTPPPTPALTNKSESKIEYLSREISQVRLEIKGLDEQIEVKSISITTSKSEAVKLKYKNLMVEDLFQVANKSLREIRDLLNQIFNPAQEEAKRLKLLMDESKRRHEKKLEKVNFELNNLLETSEEAVRNKAKQLEHEIGLQERVLLTIECQKNHEFNKEPDTDPSCEIICQDEDMAEKEEDEAAEAEEKSDEMEQETAGSNCHVNMNNTTDDECVIIENNENHEAQNTVEVGNSVRTPDLQEIDSSSKVLTDSSNTIPCVDEEETDIEEQKTDEEECFTPCQAQRPN